jgi:hypothetical protein
MSEPPPADPADPSDATADSADPSDATADDEPTTRPPARSALFLLMALAVIVTAVGLQVAVRKHFLGDPDDRVLGGGGPSIADLDKDFDEIIFEGPWAFTEGVWSLSLPGELVDPADAFEGQVNGLLGGADKAGLVIYPPRESGTLSFTVQLLGSKPAAPDWCEDEVEVSHLFATGVELNNLDTSAPLEIPEGVYRARYCASDQDGAAATKTQKLPGDYLLQLWPEGASGDVVIKQGSQFAQQRNAEVSGG